MLPSILRKDLSCSRVSQLVLARLRRRIFRLLRNLPQGKAENLALSPPSA